MNATECMPRETLKQYLAGWIDTEQTAEIEQHLSACSTCEQTIAELESDPDTLFESVRSGRQQPQSPTDSNELLSEAVARVKCFMDSESDQREPRIPTTVRNLGVYQLIQPLGRGGMGAVYLARHRTLGKQVAIKLLPESWGMRREALARFQREIRAVGKLNHQSIVSATDAGEEHGTHYLVMEFVDGMDLSRIARLVGSLKIADACALARQVALGLSYAHAEGIVHRDVKPSNLILDGNGQTKILDFGLAQLCLWDEVSAELTSVGQLMGTLDYMAPEQAERSGSVDYRADLYSLGATLFRLLCGRAPLAAAPTLSPLDKLRLLAQHQPPKLDTLRPDAPAKLVAIVSSLLAREPEGRPASAAHVAEQLAEFTADADLNALLAQARAADSQAGNPMEKQVRFSELNTGSASVPSIVRTDNYLTRSLAAAVLLLLTLGALGAVLIVLETQKGQLVIESEVADVHVKLLRDGNVTQDLRVDTGATSTRLSADKYEIMLDSPSDSIMIDKSSFVVKRGQTVVARIRTKEMTAHEAQSSQQKSAPTLDSAAAIDPNRTTSTTSQEPLYDGKPLDVWLTQLARERSPKAIGEALRAIDAMTSPGTADRILDSLTRILPSLDGNLSIALDEKSVVNVDYMGFRILAKAAPRRAYYELLAKMLATADEVWGRRILTTGLYQKAASAETDVDPLMTWLATNVLKVAKPTEKIMAWMEPAGWCFRHQLSKDTQGVIESNLGADRAASTLEKCTHLGPEFWLAQPPDATWSRRIREVVVARAMNALVEPASTPKHVTESCMIFTTVLGSEMDATGIDLGKLKDAVQTRLANIANDVTRLWQVVDVSPAFSMQRMPHRLPIQLSRRGTSQAREVIELLDLAFALKSAPGAALDVAPILKASEPEFQKVEKVLGSLTGRSPGSFGLRFISAEWPSMTNLNAQGAFGAEQLLSFTGNEWVAYLMYINAADVAGIPLPQSAEMPESSSQIRGGFGGRGSRKAEPQN